MAVMISAEKDSVIVRNAGMKEIKQKRHLMFKLREVYVMSYEEYDTKIGFNTFCNLRTAAVHNSRSTPHYTYLRQTHENFISLVNALLPMQSAVYCRECS